MKISLNWLRDYIDINETPDELSETLTALGLEVEGMESVVSHPGGLEGLVVGEVLTCGQHPDADRLSLTTVDVGGEEPLQIVCGAPNVAAGQKVVVATVGATLYPTEGDSFKIKKGKIRGQASHGMICAEDEIGLGQSHDGIMVLPADVVAGTSAADHFGVETDIVYEIGLTPNRSDATSHIGVARDLAAYYSFHSGEEVAVRMPDVSRFAEGSGTQIDVQVMDHEACPRFSGVSVSGVEIKPSPEWMQRRLRAVDVRPISNVVDITNYVLHEYGQPLHAYDQTKIKGNKIIVDYQAEGTTFQSLDEIDRKLSADDLMVCNGDKEGMCIAGVFGGAHSGVKDATTEIYLEGAHWNAQRIRKTSTRHNLRTDAAKCFEKGSDPAGTIPAVIRAAALMMEHAGASISSAMTDIYPTTIAPAEIKVRPSKINDLIGANMDHDTIMRVLSVLHMEPVSTGDDEITVKVPTDKADVTREVDVVEEVLRIYGFNNVKIDNRISTSINTSTRPDRQLLRTILGNHLIGKGYNEMMGISLVPSQWYDSAAVSAYKDGIVYINNTSNIHLDAMRPEMMLSVLQTVQYNQNRQQKNLRLFEFGKSYATADEGYEETELLSIALNGMQEGESWRSAAAKVDIYSIKRVVHELLAVMGIAKYQTRELENSRFAYGMEYHRGEQIIGRFGAVSSEARELMDIQDEVFYAELNIKSLLRAQKKNVVAVADIPKYPSSRRDLAFVIDSTVKYDSIATIARQEAKALLQEVNLFDIYQDEKVLGENKKSYAISMVFGSNDKSLKDKEIDKIIKRVIDKVQQQLGGVLRQ